MLDNQSRPSLCAKKVVFYEVNQESNGCKIDTFAYNKGQNTLLELKRNASSRLFIDAEIAVIKNGEW